MGGQIHIEKHYRSLNPESLDLSLHDPTAHI